jgi:hypothetical protein
MKRFFAAFVQTCALVLLAVCMCLLGAAFQFHFSVIEEKEPEIFDSMLCSIHTPMAAILVNSELIKCTDGKIYRWVEE